MDFVIKSLIQSKELQETLLPQLTCPSKIINNITYNKQLFGSNNNQLDRFISLINHIHKDTINQDDLWSERCSQFINEDNIIFLHFLELFVDNMFPKKINSDKLLNELSDCVENLTPESDEKDIKKVLI